jgi:hypothetical protein
MAHEPKMRRPLTWSGLLLPRSVPVWNHLPGWHALQALAPVTQNLWCRLGYPERPEPNAPSLLLSERSASLSSLVFSSLP